MIQYQEEEDILIDEEILAGSGARLVVYNDDVNTFEWVIECFIKILHHTHEQAEQLSMLIHFKGKATVKSGDHDDLKPYKDALTDRGLSAVIEK